MANHQPPTAAADTDDDDDDNGGDAMQTIHDVLVGPMHAMWRHRAIVEALHIRGGLRSAWKFKKCCGFVQTRCR